MMTYPFRLDQGHPFVSIDGADWLLVTGAPSSFGNRAVLVMGKETIPIANQYMGLTAETLSSYVGRETAGIIGCDIINRHEVCMDVPAGSITFSSEALPLTALTLPVKNFMGVPIIQVTTGELERTMALFFDTGAQISYLPARELQGLPSEGDIEDFYPGFGTFTTATYRVPLSLGGRQTSLRCGCLPDMLAMTLGLAGTQGILGNEILLQQAVSYHPARALLCL